MGDVDKPSGSTGVVGSNVCNARGCEWPEGAALADADQDHGQRDGGEVGSIGGQVAQPGHPGQCEGQATGEQQCVAKPLR